jgi:transcriptional regulator NrdR family protein
MAEKEAVPEQSKKEADGIACPECGYVDSKVIDSRATMNMIRRRRVCLKCEFRYTTYEFILNSKRSEATAKLKNQYLTLVKELDKFLEDTELVFNLLFHYNKKFK